MVCDSYELRDDVMPGAGRFRGGIGVVKKQRILTDGFITHECDRHTDPPWGIFGGGEGQCGALQIYNAARPDDITDMPAKFTGLRVSKGDVMAFYGPCGGGDGDPLDRPPEKVLEDVLDDFCTVEHARQAYGVVVDLDTETVDMAATDALRSRAKNSRSLLLPGEKSSGPVGGCRPPPPVCTCRERARVHRAHGAERREARGSVSRTSARFRTPSMFGSRTPSAPDWRRRCPSPNCSHWQETWCRAVEKRSRGKPPNDMECVHRFARRRSDAPSRTSVCTMSVQCIDSCWKAAMVVRVSKTHQLQIRISAEDKALIRARAASAGMDVSKWVLQQVFPSVERKFQALCGELASRPDALSFTFAEFQDWFNRLTGNEFMRAVRCAPEARLPPFEANYLAATVEHVAAIKGVNPPRWAVTVEALDTPWFASSLKSLRLYLLTHSPPPFRRRNLFIDSSVGQRV